MKTSKTLKSIIALCLMLVTLFTMMPNVFAYPPSASNIYKVELDFGKTVSPTATQQGIGTIKVDGYKVGTFDWAQSQSRIDMHCSFKNHNSNCIYYCSTDAIFDVKKSFKTTTISISDNVKFDEWWSGPEGMAEMQGELTYNNFNCHFNTNFSIYKKPPFKDIKPHAYYEWPVAWAVGKDITTGTSSTTFSPDNVCTRAQIVTFLWRLCGSKKEGSNNFSDVKYGDYYYDAVRWAVNNGITVGTDKNHFSPNKACTRAEIVTFLWRAAKQPNENCNIPFTDIKLGSWYEKAVRWGYAYGIAKGVTETSFNPNKSCTRAEAVTLLERSARFIH